ncbi:MAG: Glu-tRNA(Gln) amidotransferase subunit GatE [Candidatus Thermoplasmatota archaeon]|nr:Glu-tRNA(Gln) amidotransferase subunit GatE [Candidatus Thermoplasmatota archaeon]
MSLIFGIFVPWAVSLELMKMHDDVDFEALGFKCGLEIHQQLDTDRKLFCRCPPIYRNDPAHYEITRHMRPTLSEMGTYDGTALMEFKTKKNITYQTFSDTCCSYEIDETPPFEMDEKALEISMVIARAMNCALVDEVHVSRKQYLDGSIPTGFQRTAIISLGGHVHWKDERDIDIRQISIEEDACREMSDIGHEVVFRTDRLSIPLVEVVTEPNARNPGEAGELAEVLGWVMRSTGLVRRGQGATRQDVNVSVEGGVRIEIKGVPKIDLIPPITAGEAIRQHNLLEIKKELEERDADPDSMDADEFTDMRFEDVTDIFEGRKIGALNPWFDGPIQKRDDLDVKAVLIPGFSSIFSHPTHGDQTFADEVSGRLRVIACLDRMPNLLTSDDEPFGGITGDDVKAIMERLNGTEKDSAVIVWGPKEDTLTGVKEVYIRSKEAFFGVPNETRQLLTPDTTTFERILPGPDRMYPDTDRPPIVITKEIMGRVAAQVPTPWWEDEETAVRAGVPRHVAHSLVVSPWIGVFRQIVKAGVDIKKAAMFLAETMKHLKRSGVCSIEEEKVKEALEMTTSGKVVWEGLPGLITLLSKKDISPEEAVRELSLEPLKDDDVRDTINITISNSTEQVIRFREGKHGPLMGSIMKRIAGRAEGRTVWDMTSSSI